MLQITETQMDVFRRDAIVHAARRLVEHLRKELPAQWAGLADDQARQAAKSAIRRALDLGFMRQPEVWRFAEVLTLVGPDFGLSPAHHAALQMLTDAPLIARWPTTRPLVVSTAKLGPSS